MKMRKLLLSGAAGFLFMMTLLQGCSPKSGKIPFSAPQIVPQALPELPQNTLYRTNRPANELPPDYSFHPVDNQLQPVPEDAEPAPIQD